VEAQGVDLNRNFGTNFADSNGHPDFIEDKWIAKADKKKAPIDSDLSLMQMKEEEEIEMTDDQKEQAKKQSITADPRSMFYTGKAPFSEPETLAFKNFLTTH
jgi:hypothetical protein